MALYQPVVKLEPFQGKLIAHISIEVDKYEDLRCEFNNTSQANRITHIRYSVFSNKAQDYPVENFHVSIPWDSKKHTVEITVVDSVGSPLGHSSDDADTEVE